MLSIAATYGVMRLVFRKDLTKIIESEVEAEPLRSEGKLVLAGLVLMIAVLLTASQLKRIWVCRPAWPLWSNTKPLSVVIIELTSRRISRPPWTHGIKSIVDQVDAYLPQLALGCGNEDPTGKIRFNLYLLNGIRP